MTQIKTARSRCFIESGKCDNNIMMMVIHSVNAAAAGGQLREHMIGCVNFVHCC